MEIEPKQLAEKPKRIGTAEGRDIWHVRTKGGWHMVVATKNGRMETLGTGPLVAVAKFIAEKRSKIQWNELQKSEPLTEDDVKTLVPKYEAITQSIRALHGDK